MSTLEHAGTGTEATPRHSVRKTPCSSCPYRLDAPSGLWDPEEYVKLPPYDGEIMDQARHNASALFMCHHQDGQLCAGWVGCHGPNNLLALRMHGAQVADDVWDYTTDVPLHESGAAACAHGLRDVAEPSERAMQKARDLAHLRTLLGRAGV